MRAIKTKISLTILILATLLIIFGCNDDSINQSTESIIKINNTEKTIELSDNQICEYIATRGEDGATIKTQAKHFEISEINRNSETGYAAIYRYKPETNYVGYDFVEIEIMSDVVPFDEPYIGKTVKIEFFVK